MSFEEYLSKKKIDAKAFLAAEPLRYQEWSTLFQQVGEASFTSQKLYLINPTRRKFLLKEVQPTISNSESDLPKPQVKKPMFKPKIN